MGPFRIYILTPSPSLLPFSPADPGHPAAGHSKPLTLLQRSHMGTYPWLHLLSLHPFITHLFLSKLALIDMSALSSSPSGVEMWAVFTYPPGLSFSHVLHCILSSLCSCLLTPSTRRSSSLSTWHGLDLMLRGGCEFHRLIPSQDQSLDWQDSTSYRTALAIAQTPW